MLLRIITCFFVLYQCLHNLYVRYPKFVHNSDFNEVEILDNENIYYVYYI